MRRPLVLLSLAALGIAGPLLIAGTLVACGGNDKPPLTPDNLEPSGETADGGAAGAAPATTPPAK